MPEGFYGSYEHSLDAKGRLILPARFRADFETDSYVTCHHEGCLAMWTPDQFDRRRAEMYARQDLSPEDRNAFRFWTASTAAVEIDRQGRLAIPRPLLEFAGLDRAVLITGVSDRIELWNPQLWDSQVKPSESTFRAKIPAAAAAAGEPSAPAGGC